MPRLTVTGFTDLKTNTYNTCNKQHNSLHDIHGCKEATKLEWQWKNYF